MTKNAVLTKEEFKSFELNSRTNSFIEEYAATNNRDKCEVSILDWGCGRGRDVLWLNEQGYKACGVDVSNTPVNNGRNLFREKGFSPENLQVLSKDGLANFADESFDIVFSNQVFEHVSDMEVVSKELHRLTKSKGIGFHVFPSHRHLVECHLKMPFVHWLPKNRLRKLLISFYVKLGLSPNWGELAQLSAKEKTNAFYEYSVDCTHYRRFKKIKRVFEEKGFEVYFTITKHPSISQSKIGALFLRFRLLNSLLAYFLNSFKRVELYVVKQ